MLTLCEVLLFTAHARPPDLTLQATASFGVLSGRWTSEEADKLFWIESSTRNLYTTEIVEGQLVTNLLAEDAGSLMALLDYDGDGRQNLLIYRDDGEKEAVETKQSFYIPTCGRSSVGDFNGDGFDDVADALDVWLGSPTTFSKSTTLYNQEDASKCLVPPYSLGDIDGDGRNDFVRQTITNNNDYDVLKEGTLDLYLGCGYSEPAWAPHWRYDHELYLPGLSVAADVNGDGDNELVVLSAVYETYMLTGEILILDDILSPLGPTLLLSGALGEAAIRYEPDLANVGDIDGDGDDEILVTMGYLLDDGYTRVIDAEPTADGLFTIIGPSFDLPEPYYTNLQTRVGDYDGDGFKDVAVLAHSEYGNPDSGIIAIWLTTPPEGAVPPSSLPPPEDMSYCEPPVAQETADTGDPEAPPKATSCAGCANTSPSVAAPLSMLPWLTRRR